MESGGWRDASRAKAVGAGEGQLLHHAGGVSARLQLAEVCQRLDVRRLAVEPLLWPRGMRQGLRGQDECRINID